MFKIGDVVIVDYLEHLDNKTKKLVDMVGVVVSVREKTKYGIDFSRNKNIEDLSFLHRVGGAIYSNTGWWFSTEQDVYDANALKPYSFTIDL